MERAWQADWLSVVASAVFALRVTGRYTIKAGMPFQKPTLSSAHATKFTTATRDSCIPKSWDAMSKHINLKGIHWRLRYCCLRSLRNEKLRCHFIKLLSQWLTLHFDHCSPRLPHNWKLRRNVKASRLNGIHWKNSITTIFDSCTTRARSPCQKPLVSVALTRRFITAALDSCTRILEAPHVMLSTLDDRQQAHRYQ
jgi:hypothetical protein